jgi:hypothetical protein
MPSLDTRLAKLEAPFAQTGPVMILVDEPPSVEQAARIREAQDEGLFVIQVTAVDWAL